MSQPITVSTPVIDLPSLSQTKWAQEYQAFRQHLPQLLDTHRGHYVAFHNRQVVDSGDDKLALALRVLAGIGNVDIYVGRVSEEPEPVCRSGVGREVRPIGDQ